MLSLKEKRKTNKNGTYSQALVENIGGQRPKI